MLMSHLNEIALKGVTLLVRLLAEPVLCYTPCKELRSCIHRADVRLFGLFSIWTAATEPVFLPDEERSKMRTTHL